MFRFVFSVSVLFFILFFNTELSARLPAETEGNLPRKYWQFIFLFESAKAAGQSEFHFHPFYSSYQSYETAYNSHSFIYPIFHIHGTNYWQRWSSLYIFSGDNFYHVDTGADSDLFLTPLAMIGSGDSKRENYVSIFPFYGKINDFFGKEDVTFVLFPIYSSWTFKDHTSYSILWPIFLYGSSKKRFEFRLFPLFSLKKYENKYERTSFLWPFFQWGSQGLNKKEPRHYFFSFPLFGYKWSDQDTTMAWTFLWLPFLGGLASYGRDTVKEETDYSFLWSLIQYQESKYPGIRRLVIFPFYGYYRFGETQGERSPFYKEASFITPFYVNLKTFSYTADTNYHFVLPFYWDLKRYYHKEREEESHIRFWPLFKYTETSEGRTEFSSIALWPWRSDQFDKVWGPLYSIIEYRQYENRDQYFSLLFRLYSQYWNDSEEHYFLAGLEWHNDEEHWSFEILGGLLGLHRYTTREGKEDWAFELLWIDISRPEYIEDL